MCKGTGDVLEAQTVCDMCEGSGKMRRKVRLSGEVKTIEMRCKKCEGKKKASHQVCPACRGQKIEMKHRDLAFDIEKGMADG